MRRRRTSRSTRRPDRSHRPVRSSLGTATHPCTRVPAEARRQRSWRRARGRNRSRRTPWDTSAGWRTRDRGSHNRRCRRSKTRRPRRARWSCCMPRRQTGSPRRQRERRTPTCGSCSPGLQGTHRANPLRPRGTALAVCQRAPSHDPCVGAEGRTAFSRARRLPTASYSSRRH
jgi:hypothetical protein